MSRHEPSLRDKVMAGFLAVTTAALPLAANDAQAQQMAPRAPDSTVQMQQGVRVLTDKEAWRESAGRIVLHYGEGIDGADQIANILNGDGYPAMAYAGGPPRQVELFVGRGAPAGRYTQSDLNRGTLSGTAKHFYDEFVLGKPSPLAPVDR